MRFFRNSNVFTLEELEYARKLREQFRIAINELPEETLKSVDNKWRPTKEPYRWERSEGNVPEELRSIVRLSVWLEDEARRINKKCFEEDSTSLSCPPMRCGECKGKKYCQVVADVSSKMRLGAILEEISGYEGLSNLELRKDWKIVSGPMM